MKSRSKMIASTIDDIRRVFHGLTERSRRVERETGLSPTQLWVIKILYEAARMNVSELARRMYLHSATMVGVLDRLEAKELVRRVRSPEDRRVVHVSLTERGHELLRNSPEVARGDFLKGLEALTSQQLEQISTGIAQLVTILGYEEIPPQLVMSSEINIPRRRRKNPQ